jgi:pimeloyl-ACP methyl ester carboxylesterase
MWGFKTWGVFGSWGILKVRSRFSLFNSQFNFFVSRFTALILVFTLVGCADVVQIKGTRKVKRLSDNTRQKLEIDSSAGTFPEPDDAIFDDGADAKKGVFRSNDSVDWNQEDESDLIESNRENEFEIPTDQAAKPNSTSENSSSLTAACQEFRQKLPSHYFSGFLEVPENHSDKSGRKIKVFYYGRNTGKTPVVAFNGGPGYSSWSTYNALTVKGVSGWSDVDLVLIDQRGTGCSSAYPAGVDADTLQRLTHYGSAAIVKDAEAVRKALYGENQKWKAFGQSFGGFIVHRYLEQDPSGLVAGFSHGFSLSSGGIDRLFERVKSQGFVLDEYFKVYPDDRRKLFRLNAALGENSCFTDSVRKVCGKRLMAGFNSLLGFRASWETMNKWIKSMVENSGRINMQNVDRFVVAFVFKGYDNQVAKFVLNHIERNEGVFLDSTTCGTIGTRLKSLGENLNEWMIHECLSYTTPGSSVSGPSPATSAVLAEIGKLPTQHMGINRFASHLSTHSVPFYMYSGQLDSFVPPALFAQQSGVLRGRATYTNFEGSGHDGFYSEPQVLQDLMRY